MEWRKEYRKALLSTDINSPDIRDIIRLHMPEKLYKYGSFQSEYWRETVFKAKIYLSPAKVFNDPFDCRAHINYKKAISKGDFRERLLQHYSKDEIESLSEEDVQKYTIERMREKIYVFCFSEVWNSLLMWAHYANNYNGYCIEYDMTKVRDYIKTNLFPILYEEEYIDITDYLISTNSNTGLISNLIKAKEWQYEKEWRIVKYKENPFYFRPAVKAIYLGTNCSKDDKEEILKWAKDSNRKVYNIQISKTKYNLEAQRII